MIALCEEARQVVHPVEGERGEDCVEGIWLEGERLLERGQHRSAEIDQVVKRKRSITVKECRRCISTCEMRDTGANGSGYGACRDWIGIRLGEGARNSTRSSTEIEYIGKIAFDILCGSKLS